MADSIGFGLLGAGLIASFHANAIRNAPNGELIAIADINKKRAEKLAQEFNCEANNNLEELLINKNINVINVLTPNHLHKDAVLKIAQSRKHILVEKPPAMSLKDVDEMIKICNMNNVKLGIVLQCRVRPAVQAVKKAIDVGRFGKVLHVDAYMKWYRSTEYYHSDPWRSSRKSGAGVTIQHAFHYIDLLYYLVGAAKTVHAQMTNLAHPDIELEDTLLAFLQYKNGARGVVQASTALWPGTDLRIEINGTDGTAIIIGERIDTWHFKKELPEDENTRKIGSAAVATAATGPADFSFADHQILIEDMIHAIFNNHDPFIHATSARGTLEIALAMYQSAKLGREVHLPICNEIDIWD